MMGTASEEPSRDRSLILFRVHDRFYALPVEDVVEVLRMVAVTEIPDAPAWLVGLIDLRGRSLPVVDLRARLGLPLRAPGLDSVIVVVQRGRSVAGVIVDEAIEALSVSSGSIESPDDATGAVHPVIGFVNASERFILVLDAVRLLHPLDDLRLPDQVSLGA